MGPSALRSYTSSSQSISTMALVWGEGLSGSPRITKYPLFNLSESLDLWSQDQGHEGSTPRISNPSPLSKHM